MAPSHSGYEYAVSPGEHACRWFLGDETVDGSIELGGNRLPVLTLYGKGLDEGWSGTLKLGQTRTIERLVGRTRSGVDIVALHTHLSTWFPGQTEGWAHQAIVGLEVANVPNDRYEHLRVQISEADFLFGIAPFKQVFEPENPELEQRYRPVFNPASSHTWTTRDGNGTLKIECGYERHVSISHYKHEIGATPIIDFEATTRRSLQEWVDEWVSPSSE